MKKTPLATSGLPQGTPAGRGQPLDPSIPGASTFSKPVDDIREDSSGEGSIYKVDGPDGLAKKQPDADGDRRQLNWLQLEYSGPGGRPEDDRSVTKYPYRDNKPNTHNASEYVAGLWLLGHAPEKGVCIDRGVKIAAPAPVLTQGLNPKIVQKARSCQVVVKRTDIGNLRWIFAVDCGNGAKVVRVRADRAGNVTQFAKLNLHVACSCPAWRWQGPEFHSTTQDYQDPNTALQGTASAPDIRDPERINKVCKHVAAVLSFTRGWTVPNKKK